MEEDHRDKRRKSEPILNDCFDSLKKTTLPDGTTCYILVNSQWPQGIGAVSLAVRVGMVNEEVGEAGIAHALEHVLMRAAVESTGLFPLEECLSAHHMHETSYCHTIYSFNTKNPTDFVDAIKLFGEIATRKVVIEPKGLERERRVLSMEYIDLLRHPGIRVTSLVDGLVVEVNEAHSLEDCLDNLKSINCSILQDFYRKWYVPTNMALVVIGNFDDTLVNSKAQMSFAFQSDPFRPISLLSMTKSRFSEFDDENMPSVFLVVKHPRASNHVEKWKRMMLINATRGRLKSSKDCQVETLDRGAHSLFVFTAVGPGNKPLEWLLFECRRLRELGLTDNEAERARNSIMKNIEYNAALFRHFLYNDPLLSPVSECKLAAEELPRLLPDSRLLEITEASIILNKLDRSPSTVLSMETITKEVNEQPLAPWEEAVGTGFEFDDNRCDNIDQSVALKHLEEIGVYELDLSNGMRVTLCRSSLPNKCSMMGFAYGGLRERDKNNYASSYWALDIAKQLGSYPLCVPLALRESFQFDVDIHQYLRSFEAVFDKSQLNVALQFVYLLFCEELKTTDKELDIIMQFLQERKIDLRERVLLRFATGQSFKAPTSRDLDLVNPRHALEFFRQCYQDTSQFTVLIAGDFDLELAAKAVQKYLGSIPCIQCKSFPTNQSRLQKSPIIFPQSSLREEIFQDESGFVEVVICVPLKMDKGKQDRDEIVIELLDMMVERRLRRLLRAEMGHVYNITTNTLFDGKWYASLGSEEAVMTVSFCFEETSETWTVKDSKSIDWKLVDRVLEEIEDLRNGPSEVDVACFREIETEKLSCSDVLKEVMHAYQAKLYKGDLHGTYLELQKTKQEILGSDNVQFWGTEISRIMPDNCTLRNVCLALHYRALPEEEGSGYDSDSNGDDEVGSEEEEEEGYDEEGSEFDSDPEGYYEEESEDE
ncbi:hypothetical protein OROHE_000690 [Orobanche hederae]